jgi:uncharacterized protein (DUF1015 family)
MADVRAFCGVRYNLDLVADMSKVVSPPYDVISPEFQSELYERSEYGIVRIDFGKEQAGDCESSNKYTRSAELYSAFRAEGVLVADETPSVYYVEEDYVGEFGKSCTRSGFMSAVKVEDAESGVYRPHEKTLAGPRADRLKLTRACKANLSPVFSLYDDPECEIDKSLAQWKSGADEPAFTLLNDTGFEVRMWAVSDEVVLETIARVMAPKSFFIADGHHRYETALSYRKEMREQVDGSTGDYTGEEPFNFVLMYLVNMWSPGLTVLPAHRAAHAIDGFDAAAVIEKLSSKFDLTEVFGGADEVLEKMKALRGKTNAFGIGVRGDERLWLATAKADFDYDAELAKRAPALRKLDVSVLHTVIIEGMLGIDEAAQEAQTNLKYVKDSTLMSAMLAAGEIDVALYMNPTPVSDVKQAAEAGERMPQKSTYFYPKILTGLVINPLV